MIIVKIVCTEVNSLFMFSTRVVHLNVFTVALNGEPLTHELFLDLRPGKIIIKLDCSKKI